MNKPDRKGVLVASWPPVLLLLAPAAYHLAGLVYFPGGVLVAFVIKILHIMTHAKQQAQFFQILYVCIF